jgi:hypothetical protein
MKQLLYRVNSDFPNYNASRNRLVWLSKNERLDLLEIFAHVVIVEITPYTCDQYVAEEAEDELEVEREPAVPVPALSPEPLAPVSRAVTDTQTNLKD